MSATLVQQCRRSQRTVQRIIETAGDDEALLFEALNVNDEIQKVLTKYEELNESSDVAPPPLRQEPAMIPVAIEPDESPLSGQEDALIRKPASLRVGSQGGNHDEMLDDLDEMIFGKKGGNASPDVSQDPVKQQSSKDASPKASQNSKKQQSSKDSSPKASQNSKKKQSSKDVSPKASEGSKKQSSKDDDDDLISF